MKNCFVLVLALFGFSLLVTSCGKGKEEGGRQGDVPYSVSRDQNIQSYNMDVDKDKVKRTLYDTLALREYVLNNYPAGSYILTLDRTSTYNVPRFAVIYHKAGAQYVFATIAKSKPGERLIETKNVIGYESSFINLDSTKLGTAFIYLTLFQCVDSSFQVVWEMLIPIHGGLNTISYKTWRPKNIPYISLDFEDGIIVGHRDYNVFLRRDIKEFPHLLETYEGLSRKRTMANINNDSIPDYYEFFFYNIPRKIASSDSVGFIWDVKRNLYVNTRNRSQTRFY